MSASLNGGLQVANENQNRDSRIDILFTVGGDLKSRTQELTTSVTEAVTEAERGTAIQDIPALTGDPLSKDGRDRIREKPALADRLPRPGKYERFSGVKRESPW